ncbi:DUF1403 family protein [Mesorhizobium sp. BR1-1-13]|uniref:DUF1403 family protein n=1 Tax=unclassified Mesorhizobium TaxID=325217 RepID=UPI00398C8BBC
MSRKYHESIQRAQSFVILGRRIPTVFGFIGIILTDFDGICQSNVVNVGQEDWKNEQVSSKKLSAAAVNARQMGRVEDEAALHDAVLPTRPGDDVGPAGRMLLAWRWLATRPAEDLLTEASVVGVLDALGLPGMTRRRPTWQMATDVKAI